MSESPPPNFDLRQALEPFTPEEAERLRQYVELAEELRAARFFEESPVKFEIRASSQGVEFEHPFDDDEAVTVMVARLRKLHEDGNPSSGSFPRTVRLLRAHTVGRSNPSAAWIRRLLEYHEEWVDLASRSALIGMNREITDLQGKTVTESLSPQENFWDWVFAVYLHADPNRRARLRGWQPIELHKFNFLYMASAMAKAYYAFMGIVRDVLAEPELLLRDES